MTIRIAILGLGHETNTFSVIPATLELYEDGGVHRGQSLVDHYLTSQATFAGFLAEPADGHPADVELVPLIAAWINPCGAITEDAYAALTEEMLSLLAQEGPFDGVLLGLHGAAVAVGQPDVDGDIAMRVRGVVGDGVPIASVIDMHANVSERLVSSVDLLFAYQTNPHVDARARGLEAKTELLRIVRGHTSPHVALVQLPLVVTITKQDTAEEPLASLLRFAASLEAREGVIDASIVEGFPYADVAQMGMSVLATHARSIEAAQAVANELALSIWAQRAHLQGGGTPVAEAVAAAAQHADVRPLLVLDVGDNVGGGGPGDSTALLSEAIRQGLGGAVGIICDADAVLALSNAKPGDQVSVSAGAAHSPECAPPLVLTGTLVARSDGRYEEPKIAHGGLRFFDAGDTVAVETKDGLTVVICSKLVQPITPHQLTSLGLDPLSFRAIFAKGVNGPRAGYADYTSGVIVADTPGVTRLSVEAFHYDHRRRPMYPFELDAHFSVSSERTQP